MARRKVGNSLHFVNRRSIRAGALTIWIAACRRQHRSVVRGDEFAITRDQIADQCGLAALTRPRTGVISIVPAGWKLRPVRIKVASISDYRLVCSRTEPESAGTLGSWRGVPCLGVALNKFREDSGKLAPEVALVFVDLA